MNLQKGVPSFEDIVDTREGPPPGDVSWLWFKPVAPSSSSSINPSYSCYCLKCDVFDVQDPGNKYFRCWNCGIFLKAPKVWSENMYKPTGYWVTPNPSGQGAIFDD